MHVWCGYGDGGWWWFFRCCCRSSAAAAVPFHIFKLILYRYNNRYIFFLTILLTIVSAYCYAEFVRINYYYYAECYAEFVRINYYYYYYYYMPSLVCM
jgi:hypothetical protein